MGSCTKCKQKWKAGDPYVSCVCKDSFHAKCVGLEGLNQSALEKLKNWRCPRCQLNDLEAPNGDLMKSVQENVMKLLEEKLPELVANILAESFKNEITKLVKDEVEKAVKSVSVPVSSPNGSLFSDILKKGQPSGPVAKLAQLVRKEESEQEFKKDRLVFRGLTLGEDECEDESIVREVAEEIGVNLDGVRLETKRIGKGERASMVSVKIDSLKRKDVLKNSKNLKGNDKFGNVYINPDRTRGELHNDFLLRSELKERRQAESTKQWVIFRGKVIEKTENFR